MNKNSRDKCKPSCDVVTFSENQMSTKMLQAMMLKLKGGKISYHNSRTKSTHTTILSLNYIENRLLLLRFRYRLYAYYVNSLSNVNRTLFAKIVQMVDTLVTQLTPEERNIVFDTVPPDPPIPEVFEESGIVFKVVAKRIVGFSYFILTNIKNNYVFETGKSYTFDLSDPTQVGTAFCLSLEKDGVAYDCRYHLTPGQPGATMKVYISRKIPYTHLYVFNRDETNGGSRYEQWGYSYESLYINRDKLVIDDVASATFKTFDTSYLKFVVYEWYGPKIMIDPFVSADPTKPSNPVYLYKNNYMYKLGIGVHYLYLHNYYSLAFLTRNRTTIGFSSEYNRGSKTLDQLFLAGNGLDGTYTFHSGMIRLTITGPFDPISLYNDRYGYMGGLFMIQYSSTSLKSAIPDEFVYTQSGYRYGLDSHALIDPVRFTFQKIPYDTQNEFALAPGVYTWYNTSDVPFTILLGGKTPWITLEGISTTTVNGTTMSDAVLGIGPQGEELVFYYGTVIVRVYGDFGRCSLYTPRTGLSGGGYRGGHGRLVYDETFSNGPSYTAREMIAPTIIPNTAVCNVGLEVFKPISVVTLSLSDYTLNLGDLYRSSVRYGDASTYEMRYQLTSQRYAFAFQGKVTVYGTNATIQTETIGIATYRTIGQAVYPVYVPSPGQSSTSFFVKIGASGASNPLQEFTVVHEQGGSVFTYFMTFSTS